MSKKTVCKVQGGLENNDSPRAFLISLKNSIFNSHENLNNNWWKDFRFSKAGKRRRWGT